MATNLGPRFEEDEISASTENAKDLLVEALKKHLENGEKTVSFSTILGDMPHSWRYQGRNNFENVYTAEMAEIVFLAILELAEEGKIKFCLNFTANGFAVVSEKCQEVKTPSGIWGIGLSLV